MTSSLYDKVREILDSVGVGPGDTLMVHSDMGYLPHLIPREEWSQVRDKRNHMLGSFHAAVADVIGPDGAVCVLGSFSDYARHGKPFILEESVPDKELGAYNAFLFQQEGMCRSLNPLVGVIAKGGPAGRICAHRSANGYGQESPWASMLELDGKMVFWGVGLGFMTFVHHVEQVVGVPHIYNKLYPTPVYRGGHRVDLPVITAVRYLDYSVVYNLTRFENDLGEAGKIRSTRCGELEVRVASFRDVMSHLTQNLARDPYYLLDHPPAFVPGEVPTDGLTGPPDPSLGRRS